MGPLRCWSVDARDDGVDLPWDGLSMVGFQGSRPCEGFTAKEGGPGLLAVRVIGWTQCEASCLGTGAAVLGMFLVLTVPRLHLDG